MCCSLSLNKGEIFLENTRFEGICQGKTNPLSGETPYQKHFDSRLLFSLVRGLGVD